MKREKTLTRFNLFLTTGNTIEVLADEIDTFSTEEYMTLRRESHLVAKFMKSAILGYTREDIENGRKNDD